MYCVRRSQICSRAVVSRNLNPASVTPSSSPSSLSPMSFAARNNAPTSRRLSGAFFFFPGAQSSSRADKSNASLAPVSVRSSASHRPLAKASRSSREGTTCARSFATPPSPRSSSSTSKLRSNIRRNPVRNRAFNRTHASPPPSPGDPPVSSFVPGFTSTSTRRRLMWSRLFLCISSPSGLIHASTSDIGTPASMYSRRIA
mmetsp:Transcript_8350/g.34888  ORF Transcript_8350/g.34888 Transcript_8350/m.34888 type:complete len:201 (+) Transcript_8350:1635-2237(+)